MSDEEERRMAESSAAELAATAHCPVCDSVETQPWYPAEIQDAEQVSFSYTFSPHHNRTFQVLRCRICTHAYCFPIPADIARHYRDVMDEEYLRHETSRILSAGAVLEVLKKHRPCGRLLDVGCATGDLLVAATRLGFEAEGLELSDWSSTIARKRGFTVHQERLGGLAERSPATYDLITLMGVIEHFAQPREELAHLSRLLKPGGILAIWTGDVDSSLSRILGRGWWYWQGQHIQYFTRRSLTRLSRDAGLHVVATSLYPFAATQDTIGNSLRRYRSHRFLTWLLRPLFALKPVWLLRLPGEMLHLARRPEAPPPERFSGRDGQLS
jgi:2-polyprenyl-3-methyl-5-hydroxy-6-metoxy-1,4-benzoquinol methylase